MNEDRTAWLEERRKGIGGSDCSVLFDENPYKTRMELWEEKTGKVELEEIDSGILERGRVLEPIVADKYAEVTGRLIQRRNNPFLLDGKDHIRCNIDRIILKDERGPGVLEIKTATLPVFRKFIHFGLPAMYHLQLQHNMLAAGHEWGAFAFFNADTWKLHHFDIDADKTMQERIEEECDTFWFDYVQKDIPPPEEIVEARFALPAADSGTIVTLNTDEWVQAAQDLKEAEEIADDATALLDNAKERLKGLMGDFEIVEGGGLRCYHKTSAGRKSLDKSKLVKDNPDLDLEKYMKQGKPSRSFRKYWVNDK